VSILNPLFYAVAWVIMRIHAVLSVPFGAASGWSWGLSIVILVMAMRLVMVPLFVKQVKSQRKMQSHMPQLQEMRKRYKNDKTRLNEETMKFYKENGINPLGGCLPIVAQLPVFWSLFNVLKAIADWNGGTPKYGLTSAAVNSAKTAHVFGVLLSDKFLWATTGESWTVRAVILVSVLASACTTFLTMRQSAKRGMMNQTVPDPDQPGAAMAANMSKNMMYIAPFFALTGLYWQYGLVIYWVTTNLWTLGQQHFLFRNLPVVGSATVGASVVQAASGNSGSVAKSSAVKSGTARSGTARSVAAKGNGAASNGTASNGSGKVASKSTTSGMTSSAAKAPAAKAPATRAAAAKAPAVKAPAAKAPAVKAPAAKAPAPKADANGVVASGTDGYTGPPPSTGRGLLGLGRKKPETEAVPVAPEVKIARQQPVRQTRSKRSGSSGSGTSGKR
jgi:YidC/Oxa1 family membrane protein insertase